MEEIFPTQSNENIEENTKSESIQHDQDVHEKQKLPPSIANFFSTKKPRDAMDGMASGAGNIFKGIAAGTAVLFAAPVAGAVEGAKSGGATGAVKGFGVGLGAGIAGGAGIAAAGTATGMAQVGRGMYHTPGAVGAITEGKDWDDEKREWIIYDLQVEADEIMAISEEDLIKSLLDEFNQWSENKSTENISDKSENLKKVADLEYYNTLGVLSNATSADIKKAYYIKAKQSHPDRHPDDPDAHAKFQKIGEAYQVLSDEKLRANYDAGGKDGIEGVPKVDSGALFAMIFGSEKFEPLLGELQLASQMQVGEGPDAEIQTHPKLVSYKQKKRQIQCALNLVKKLQPYIDSGGDKDIFLNILSEEIKELSNSPFGGTLLMTIGKSYHEHARSELGSFDGMAASMENAWRGMATRANIVYSGAKAAYSASEIQKLKKRMEEKEEKQAKEAKEAKEGVEKVEVKEVKEDEKKEYSLREKFSQWMKSDDKKVVENPDELLKKRMEDMSTAMVAVMWHVTELDIRATLKKVCKKVTHDHSVDEATRIKRTHALKILGEGITTTTSTTAHTTSNITTNTNTNITTKTNTNITTNTNTNTNTSNTVITIAFIQHGLPYEKGLQDIKQRLSQQMMEAQGHAAAKE